jgi:cell division protein FtsL
MIRPAMILIVLLAASLGVTLFIVKYQVQDLENQLVRVNREITDDRQSIHVLKAEWSHLNEPKRLRGLAERYLGLSAVETKQVGTMNEWFGATPKPAANVAGVVPLVAPVVQKDSKR